MSYEPSLETKRALVMNAIRRIQRAERYWKDLESNPGSSESARMTAKAAFNAAEQEFGWQWSNVFSMIPEDEFAAFVIETEKQYRELLDRLKLLLP